MIVKRKLQDFCTIERAKKDKVYPKGTLLVELSATKGFVDVLYEDGMIDSRYAAVTPQKFIDPYYFRECVRRCLPEFITKYLTTINLQIGTVGLFEIEYDTDLIIQKEIGETLKRFDEMIRQEERTIETLQEVKKNLLQSMFV